MTVESQNDQDAAGQREYVVEARCLHVRFTENHVLRDICLSIPTGETLAIIGESGCGKTVLLKTLIGLIQPSEGEVFLNGKDLAKLNEQQLAEQRTRFGFVFQGSALFDSMTVEQNVAFPLRQHSLKSEQEIHEIVVRRLADVGLSPAVLRKRPAELSGGMRKRVGLARALAMSPDVLLYDEPTTGLDPIMSDVISELILRTRDRYPVTSVVVTHDMHAAIKVADRIVMFYPTTRLEPDEPQILYDGLPSDIEHSPDPRVSQFVLGLAGDRISEMKELRSA